MSAAGNSWWGLGERAASARKSDGMLVYVHVECGTVPDTTTLEAALLQAANNSSTLDFCQQQVTRGGVWVSGQQGLALGSVKTCWCMYMLNAALSQTPPHWRQLSCTPQTTAAHKVKVGFRPAAVVMWFA
jgi:hypothetical protein